MRRPVAELACLFLLALTTAVAAEDKVLFDFEDATDLAKWSNFDLAAARSQEWQADVEAAQKAGKPAPAKPAAVAEPPVKIEFSTDEEKVTSGKQALKLTFAGGQFPTISVEAPLADWTPYKAFRADVYASRTCMVVFRVMAEASRWGTAYNDGCSRWEKAARLSPGKNTVVAVTPSHANYAKVRIFQIYMYQPKEGETIYVDNIRLSTTPPQSTTPFWEKDVAAPGGLKPAGGFKVLGTDLTVSSANELMAKLQDKWIKPEDKKIEQVETEIQSEYENIKKTEPKALLAVLRQGQKGFDPADLEKVFSGWEDARAYCHSPSALTMTNFLSGIGGKNTTLELTFSHRPSPMRIDLSSIPKSAKVLAARLVLVRSIPGDTGQWGHGCTKPTMFVAEPFNKPWVPAEITVFEYAKDKFWNDFAGATWDGAEPDRLPFIIAHGPSQGAVCVWDFTEAVKFWRDGQHLNYGFVMGSAGDKGIDFLNVHSSKAVDLKKRPALAVIYVPQE